MTENKIIANEIYEALRDAGAEIGNASIPIIKQILDYHVKSEKWEQIALEGNLMMALKELWHQEDENPNRDIMEIKRRVLTFMGQHGIIPENKN